MATDPILSRRTTLRLAAAFGAVGAAPAFAAESGDLTVGDDGLYKQDWFLDSFLDIGEDVGFDATGTIAPREISSARSPSWRCWANAICPASSSRKSSGLRSVRIVPVLGSRMV